MKILVTGSAGFLGTALCHKISDESNEVLEYDLPKSTILKDDKWNPSAVYYLDNSIEESDIVIHCAAVADLNESAKDKELNTAVNVDGTRNVANLCKKYNKLMIFISTCCVYGNHSDGSAHEGIITEETQPYPTEIYAKSKLLGECICAQTKRLRYRVARIATLYGEDMRPELFSYIALDKIANGEEIQIHGNGEQTRAYCYISDVINGILTIAEDGIDGEVYNVAGEEQTSVNDTIGVAIEIVNKFVVVKFIEDRDGQILKENISSDKLKKLGWKPEVSYKEGMKLTYQWMLKKKAGC